MAYTNAQRTTQTRQVVFVGHRTQARRKAHYKRIRAAIRTAAGWTTAIMFFLVLGKPGLQIVPHLWKKFSLQHLSIWELQLYLSMYGKCLAAIVHITTNTIGRWKNDLYYWRRKVH